MARQSVNGFQGTSFRSLLGLLELLVQSRQFIPERVGAPNSKLRTPSLEVLGLGLNVKVPEHEPTCRSSIAHLFCVVG